MAESPHIEDIGTARASLRRADSLLALAQVADPTWWHGQIARGWVLADLAGLLTGNERLAAIRNALGLAEEAVRRHGGEAEALELRGTLRMRLVNEIQAAPDEPDRMRKAEDDLRAALDRDSSRTVAWVTLGDLLWTKGSTAEAEIASRRALQEDTYLAEALTIYKDLFFNDLMQGDFARAGEWCRRGRLAFPARWRFVECELTLMRHDARSVPDPDSAWALVRRLDSWIRPSWLGRRAAPITRSTGGWSPRRSLPARGAATSLERRSRGPGVPSRAIRPSASTSITTRPTCVWCW